MYRITLTSLMTLFIVLAFPQDWIQQADDGLDFKTIKKNFESHWNTKAYQKGRGFKQFKRWEYFVEPRLGADGKLHRPDATWKAFQELRSRYGQLNASSRAGAWTPLGPYSWVNSSYNPGMGRVNVIEEDPNDPNTIFVGAPAGGLWRSTDNGSTWSGLTDNLPTLGVSGIVIDPNNSQLMYISTGDGDGADTYSNGVLKSTDGGITWNSTGLNWQTSQSRTTRRLLMDPNNSSVLFCAASNGLFRTADAGATWTQIMSGSMRDVEFHPNDPNVVYTCTDEFYRSTDGGLTFSKVTSGLPSAANVNRMSVAVSPATPNTVYALCGKSSDGGFEGLYRSTDSGISWTQMSSTPNIFGYDAGGNDSGGQSSYDMALEADETTPGLIYSGGINVWKSTNGGSSWINCTVWTYPNSTGYTHADIHALHMVGGRLYCGSDGGIFRSFDQADNWTDLSDGLQITQFYRLGLSNADPNVIAAGSQDNGSWALGSGTWLHTFGADGMEAAVDPVEPNIMYFSFQNGGLRRSFDSGNSTSSIKSGISESGAWVTPYQINPQNRAGLFSAFSEVYKSTNRGSSWTAISNFPGSSTLRHLTVAPSDSSTIYCGNSSSFWVTTDGGANWTDILPGLPSNTVTYTAVHPSDPNTIYVTLSGSSNGEKVYVSTDAGSTWQNISGNLPNVPANCIVFEAGSSGGLYVGMDIGIFYTDSTLSAWQPFYSNLPNVIVSELEIHYPTSKIRAATYGRGMWESPLYQALNVPPSANFSVSDTVDCSGLANVKFSDASIGASPGWQWQFPGGSPSTSTDQFPTVSYPPGTYTARLVVANSIGNDTVFRTFQVLSPEYTVNLDILTDNYPTETTWSIVNASNEIVANGGPYQTSNTQYSEQVCLEAGCYTFNINDSYGDGICCGYGQGSYTLGSIGLGDVFTGGTFVSSESTDICLGANLQIKAFLEGPYDQNTGTMRDDLRSAGLIPLTEPYSNLGHVAVGVEDSARISPNASSVTGNDALVDWLWFELEDGSGSALATQVGLVQRDGDVVSVGGDTLIHFNTEPSIPRRVIVRHRNHFGVATAQPVTLSNRTMVDFSSASTNTWGVNALKDVNGTRLAWAGNVNSDSELKYTGADNDRDPILVRVGGSVPTAISAGYHLEDVNLDGAVKYTGAANDRDIILVNIGGSIPTNTRVEQLP